MPYSYPNNIPSWAKNLPTGAQKKAISAFNSVLRDNGTEEEARIAAWANVRRDYKKSGGKWVKKTFSIQIDDIVTLDELTDDILELPGKLPVVWMKLFNGLVEKQVSVPLARQKVWESIKKYVYQTRDGSWKFKKLLPAERILFNDTNKERVPKMLIFKQSNSKDGLFKMFIPFQKGVQTDPTGKKFLKGIASGNWVDRESDQIMPTFIKKMHSVAIGKPVFVDHKRDQDHLIGSVVKSDGDDDKFIPTTELEDAFDKENQEGNIQVSTLLKRMDRGIKFAYSIGGRITKAAKVWREDLKKFVRQIYDGELYEVSVVPVGALPGSDVVMFSKNLTDEMFEKDELDEEFEQLMKSAGVDISKIEGDVEVPVIGRMEEDDYFWLDFDKAVDAFSDLSMDQPKVEDVDVDSLSKECFILQKSKRFPYKFNDNESGENLLHLGLLDKSFQEAHDQAKHDSEAKLAYELINGIRKTLGIKDKYYNFIDFRKLLVGTIGEAIEARQARQRLYDVFDEFNSSVYQVIWSDASVAEKKSDIDGLADQLKNEIDELSVAMSQEVVVAMKSLSVKE